jgi:hypothetical protein
MNTMPVAYLENLRLEFTDGRVWEIDVQAQLTAADADAIADRLLSVFHEYQEDIKKIDFKVDVEKLKNDIKKSTDSLF